MTNEEIFNRLRKKLASYTLDVPGGFKKNALLKTNGQSKFYQILPQGINTVKLNQGHKIRLIDLLVSGYLSDKGGLPDTFPDFHAFWLGRTKLANGSVIEGIFEHRKINKTPEPEKNNLDEDDILKKYNIFRWIYEGELSYKNVLEEERRKQWNNDKEMFKSILKKKSPEYHDRIDANVEHLTWEDLKDLVIPFSIKSHKYNFFNMRIQII